MINYRVIKHNNLEISDLEDIIRVKSFAWNYSYSEQIKWIENNLNNQDIHILLYNDNSAVAYLNLIDIELTIDGKKIKSFGIGNVCTTEKGKGFGSELMKFVNKIIFENNRTGLLLCKNDLIPFYLKCGWELVQNENIKFSFEIKKINAMIFNYLDKFSSIIYSGKPF